MYMSPEWQCYIRQLNEYLQFQNQQMQQMNKLIQQLVQDVNQLKQQTAQPPVIRNEYRFDLLKVEKLDGTLNIGIKPDGGGSSIEEFAVGQSMDVRSVEKEYPELCETVQKRIHEYLSAHAYNAIKGYENKFNFSLDDPYRNFIIEDVKKQIDGRIRYYINQIKPEQMEPEQVLQMEHQIVEQVIRDIERTLEAFIKNLPKENQKE